MRKLPLYQVDAFTSEVFRGNPAAVCPLDEWLPDDVLLAVAAENNLSETAYFVPEGEGYRLRWFTPRQEVPLCGHATLATAYVLFRELGFDGPTLHFESAHGPLRVSREGELLTLDFPAVATQPLEGSVPGLFDGVDVPVAGVLCSTPDTNYILVLERQEDVVDFDPPLAAWEELHPYGVAVTAPAADDAADFVSRYFVPSYGIPEDPVTGSLHCALTPYWAERLGRSDLRAHQVSRRGGELRCRLHDDRVLISGAAVLYLRGEITVP